MAMLLQQKFHSLQQQDSVILTQKQTFEGLIRKRII